MNEIILVFTFILSFLLTIYGTPLAQRVAFRYQLLDQPDGKLKKQAQPVPYMGGVIVYFSFISPISLVFHFNQQLLGILFASSILLLVGLFDDFKALTPGIKFLFQIVTTYILLKSGIVIDLTIFPLGRPGTFVSLDFDRDQCLQYHRHHGRTCRFDRDHERPDDFHHLPVYR